MLGQLDGYEVWYVPDYEASKILGRNYKHRPTHWCISSDDLDYWYENYDTSEFMFLIRSKPKNDNLDKIAVEFENGGHSYNRDKINVWDLDDVSDREDGPFIPDSIVHEVWIMFKDSGMHREQYY